jgi:hypothetical protein
MTAFLYFRQVREFLAAPGKVMGKIDRILRAFGKGGVADGIRTRNNKLHKLGLYH